MLQLRALPRRLAGLPLVLIIISLAGAGASGAWIWHNTNQLNDYRTRDDVEAQQADYEKRYIRYEKLKQPSTTDVTLRVDLYPEERRMADTIDIGLFTARPGQGAFSAKDVLVMTRLPVKTGRQTLVLISKARPSMAGIDPYNKYVDRNSDDNLVDVN